MEKMQYECAGCGQKEFMSCGNGRLSNAEFSARFRSLCREYVLCFPCECLASCVPDFQQVLSENRNGVSSFFVESLFSILLEEFQKECVRRIASFGGNCPR